MSVKTEPSEKSWAGTCPRARDSGSHSVCVCVYPGVLRVKQLLDETLALRSSGPGRENQSGGSPLLQEVLAVADRSKHGSRLR